MSDVDFRLARARKPRSRARTTTTPRPPSHAQVTQFEPEPSPRGNGGAEAFPGASSATGGAFNAPVSTSSNGNPSAACPATVTGSSASESAVTPRLTKSSTPGSEARPSEAATLTSAASGSSSVDPAATKTRTSAQRGQFSAGMFGPRLEPWSNCFVDASTSFQPKHTPCVASAAASPCANCCASAGVNRWIGGPEYRWPSE